MALRHPEFVHLHDLEGGPHPRQPPPCPSPQGPPRHLRRLQGYVHILSCPRPRNHLTTPVPHPLFATIELRVQTDGTLTPKEAIIATARSLLAELGQLSREFTKEYELRKMVAGAATDANQAPQ